MTGYYLLWYLLVLIVLLAVFFAVAGVIALLIEHLGADAIIQFMYTTGVLPL